MNRYWHVLQTYLWRPRFWVLGALYLLLAWGALWTIIEAEEADLSDRTILRNQAIVSAVYACLAGCFLGLHVRRQFSHSSAQLLPGYATPHLVVAALVAQLLWFILPSVAILLDFWPPGALALHACGALLMSIVICWPRGLLLVAAVPVLLIWGSRRIDPHQLPPMIRLAEGEMPLFAATLVAAAVVGQIVAAVALLRLPRSGVATNDDLSIDSAAAVQDLNLVSHWLLSLRDVASERLMDSKLSVSIQRWRVPMAVSPVHLALPAVAVLVAALVGALFGDWITWGSLAIMVTCAVLLLVPLSPWDTRRRAMGQELLRPVTRQRYYREVILSLAFDTTLWMAVASAIIVVSVAIDVLTTQESDFGLRTWIQLAILLSILWSLATFVFGAGLYTLRWPMRLPIVAGITMVWFFGGLAIYVLSADWYFGPNRTDFHYFLLIFVPATFATGLFLARSTYRRWLRSDVP